MPLATLPFPDIGEVLLSIGPYTIDWLGGLKLGPFAIRWYALSYIAGLLFAWFYARRLVANRSVWRGEPPAKPMEIDDLLFWGALGVFFGGRFGYVLLYNPLYYLQNPLEIFAVWSGGMSFHGGFIGVVLVVVFFCRSRQLRFLPTMDAVATGVPIGLFFGRLANFINQELYGRVTDVPWAVIFPRSDGAPRHPSQLYEAALEGVVLFVILRLCTHWWMRLSRPGFVSGVFAIGYGLSRMFVELFRLPDSHIGYLTGILTMGMALSLPMVLIGLFLILRAREDGDEPGHDTA